MPSSRPSTLARALFALLCRGVMGVGLIAIAYQRRRGLPVPQWPLPGDLFVTIPLACVIRLRPAAARFMRSVSGGDTRPAAAGGA